MLRGAPRVAVIGPLGCFPLELVLAVGGDGQRSAGRGRSQVGKLADGTGEVPQ